MSVFLLLGKELSVIPDLQVHCRQPHGLLRCQVTRRGKMANAHRLKSVDARSVLISDGSVATDRGDARRLDWNPKVQGITVCSLQAFYLIITLYSLSQLNSHDL